MKNLLGILACSLVSMQALATEAPEYVKIANIEAAGSGCPLGTVAKNVSSDKKAFTLSFSEFFAELYPGSLPSDSRKNCNLVVDLEFPEGWTYSVVSLDYRGFLDLSEGAKATTEASYYFQSQEEQVSFKAENEGPSTEDYSFRDTLNLNSVIWSPSCQGDKRALNIKTDIRLSSQDPWAEGLLTVDSIDGQFTQKYALVWKRCEKEAGDSSDEYRPPYDDLFPSAPSAYAINKMTYNGSGCPLGTVASNISEDKKAFTLIFDQFLAEAGQGVSIRESRKFCQITLDIDAPKGWSYALATFDYRGYAFLDDKVEAQQDASYYYQGANPGRDLTRTLKLQAPNGDVYDGDYTFRDYVPVNELNWSPCGASRALNVKASVRVNNRRARNSSGLITVDSLDGQVGVYHGLVWKPCR